MLMQMQAYRQEVPGSVFPDADERWAARFKRSTRGMNGLVRKEYKLQQAFFPSSTMILRPTSVWRAIVRLRVGYRNFHRSGQRLAEALRDEAIQARYVRVVDPSTGSLSERVERVSNLLKKMDRTRYWLVQVKAGRLDQEAKEAEKAEKSSSGSAGGGKSKTITSWTQSRPDEKRRAERLREELEAEMPLEDLAIVKMIDKKVEYNRLKERKLVKKEQSGGGQRSGSVSGASAIKSIDLTWSSTTHDVEHKLKTLVTHFRKKGPGAKGTVDVKAKQGKGRVGGMDSEHKMEMLRTMEEYLCNWEPNASQEEPAQEYLYYARRAGDIEWRAGGSHATLRMEVVKGRRPFTITQT